MAVEKPKPKQFLSQSQAQDNTIFSQPRTDGIHGVFYLLSQTNEEQKQNQSRRLRDTNQNQNTMLGFNSQLDFLGKPTSIPCLFLISRVIAHHFLETMTKPKQPRVYLGQPFETRFIAPQCLHNFLLSLHSVK